MRLSLCIVLLSLLCVSLYGQDGEDPGPPELFMDPSVQICWYGQVDDAGERIWSFLTATDIRYSTDPPDRHYWVHFGAGDHHWRGSMGDGRFANFTLNITAPEDIDWHWRGPIPSDPNQVRPGATHYEMRWRVMCYPETDDVSYSNWSEINKVYFIVWPHPGRAAHGVAPGN